MIDRKCLGPRLRVKIKYQNFTREIASVINRHSVDSVLGIPDFILAEFIVDQLDTIENLHLEEKHFHGVKE